MAENSGIAWTNNTFNGWIGCTKVSAGCKNCYAEREHDHKHRTAQWGPNGTRVVTSDVNWRKPEKWQREAAAAGKRTLVFAYSLADVFEEWPGGCRSSSTSKPGWLYKTDAGKWYTEPKPVDLGMDSVLPVTLNDVRLRLFDLIRRTPNLIWQLLTKRPQNVILHLSRAADYCRGREDVFGPDLEPWLREWIDGVYPHNVWMGTSVEDEETAHARIPILRTIPAVMRWLSVEPQVGDIGYAKWIEKFSIDPYFGWVVVGGESGPTPREFRVEWARRAIRECGEYGVPVFVKQMGATASLPGLVKMTGGGYTRGRIPLLLTRAGDEPEEWPEDVRVRQFPVY